MKKTSEMAGVQAGFGYANSRRKRLSGGASLACRQPEKKANLAAGLLLTLKLRYSGANRNDGLNQARFLNSLVRVSISILSPISMKAATGNSKPVLILAGFITLPEVSPRTAGSV